jgi:poly-gamma-glutamate synthesis protein (capsule biosynthesis protein)
MRPLLRPHPVAARVAGLAPGLLVLLAVGLPLAAQSRSPVGADGRWTLAAVGDVIMNRRLAQFDHPGDPAFHEMAELIRAQDASFLNLEQSVFRLEEFAGWPAAENGGNYEVGDPETLADLKAMGFDLFNRANNHSTDYGVEGLRQTNRLLDEMGLVHSGTGENLGWASRPGYLETPQGRFALIGMASSHTPMSRAGAPAPEVMGRPGLNPLRIDRRTEAAPGTLASLRSVARAYGAEVPDDPARSVRVLGTTVFPGEADRVVESVAETDRERVLSEVRNAANLADFVVANSHSHEPGNGSVTPPAWMIEWSHAVIDAGAHAWIVHGPHQLRGIEIYRGRPIFYSLGNFIFQNETIDPMPADMRESYGTAWDALAGEIYDARFGVDENGVATTGFPAGSQWYESVVAVMTFEGDELAELVLHPIELGWRAPRSQRGTPRVAPEELGRKIIEHIAELSRPFGTLIRYENGVGVWRRTARTEARR